MRGQLIQRDMRRAAIAAQIKRRVQLHQILVAAPILRQKHKCCGRHGPLAGADRVVIDIDLATDDGLHPCLGGGFRKLQGAKHVVAIGHGDGGHARINHHTGQLFHPHRPFEQRVFRVQTQVNEFWIGHGRTLPQPHARWNRNLADCTEIGRSRYAMRPDASESLQYRPNPAFLGGGRTTLGPRSTPHRAPDDPPEYRYRGRLIS